MKNKNLISEVIVKSECHYCKSKQAIVKKETHIHVKDMIIITTVCGQCKKVLDKIFKPISFSEKVLLTKTGEVR